MISKNTFYHTNIPNLIENHNENVTLYQGQWSMISQDV